MTWQAPYTHSIGAMCMLECTELNGAIAWYRTPSYFLNVFDILCFKHNFVCSNVWIMFWKFAKTKKMNNCENKLLRMNIVWVWKHFVWGDATCAKQRKTCYVNNALSLPCVCFILLCSICLATQHLPQTNWMNRPFSVSIHVKTLTKSNSNC